MSEATNWRLDQQAAALLHTMTGSDNAEDATEVTLFVGESRDDDGKLVYGLHAYESEYPEEGVIPLVEFDRPAEQHPTEFTRRIAELLVKVPLPPKAITYEAGVALLDELQGIARDMDASQPKDSAPRG